MFAKQNLISQVLGYFAAGTTKRTTTILDMANYDGVLFIIGLGTIIEAGTLDGFVEQNIANSTVGMARLATTSAYTVTAADAAKTQSCILIDVFRPQERYIQANITPAVQNAVVLGCVAIQYSGRVKPETQGSSVLVATSLGSPAEA